MQITISNEITVQNPTSELLAYCNSNLTIANPEYIRRKRMGLWLGNTPERLYLFRTDGNKLILPTGAGKILRPYVSLTKPKIDLANNPHVDYKANISLYDYQEPAVKTLANNSCGILQAPCGSGKTVMAIDLVNRLGMKALFLTHTIDLLNQAKETAETYMPHDLIGTITGGKVNISSGVTFATVQTMCKMDLSQYKYTWDVVIVDECHRLSHSATQVKMFSKVVNSLAARHKYGVSATLTRSDGMIESTFAVLGPIIYTIPQEAVADKTMQVTVQKINTGAEIQDCCLDTDGTIIYANLIKYLAEDETRNDFIARHIAQNGLNHSNLILSDRINHLKFLKDKIVKYGVPESEIRMIDGKMTSKKGKEMRKQALEDMRTGKAKYLFASYTIAKEGLNVKPLDRLYLTLPKKDQSVVIQSVGRIARTDDGKCEPVCYDFVDNIGYCANAYKKRKTAYRKAKCIVKE